MNRNDVVRGIAHKEDVPVVVVNKVLGAFLDLVALSLATGDDVAIRDFGTFEPRARKAVTRRNPKTGEPIPTPAKTSVGFRPSRTLKERLNRHDDN